MIFIEPYFIPSPNASPNASIAVEDDGIILVSIYDKVLLFHINYTNKIRKTVELIYNAYFSWVE